PRPLLRRVEFRTPRAHVVAISEGAALESIQLLGDKFTRHKGAKEESQVDLVEARAGEPLPFSTEVKGADGAVLIPRDAAYELVRQDVRSATFRAEVRGVVITK